MKTQVSSNSPPAEKADRTTIAELRIKIQQYVGSRKAMESMQIA